MTKKKVPRLEDDEIKRVAKGLVEGHVFTATMCPPDMIGHVFMVAALGGLSDFDPDDVAMLYEWLDKAGERGINGYPMFMSCRVVCHDDWNRVVEMAEKIVNAVAEALK